MRSLTNIEMFFVSGGTAEKPTSNPIGENGQELPGRWDDDGNGGWTFIHTVVVWGSTNLVYDVRKDAANECKADAAAGFGLGLFATGFAGGLVGGAWAGPLAIISGGVGGLVGLYVGLQSDDCQVILKRGAKGGSNLP